MLRNVYIAARRRIMIRSGFDPSNPHWSSKDGYKHAEGSHLFFASPMKLPNLAGYLHPAVQSFIAARGLGERCLLVSESKKVGQTMSVKYPETKFVACDLFDDLQAEQHGGEGRPDFRWDVTDSPPDGIGPFHSVIAHALLEHVIDPVLAIRNMLALLRPDGHLFLMTHTPSFHVHRYPRDYIRFNQDFWIDLPAYMARRHSLDSELTDLYWHDGIFCAAYRRSA